MAGVGFEQKHVNVLLYAEVIVRCKHRAHRHHIGEMESQLPFIVQLNYLCYRAA